MKFVKTKITSDARSKLSHRFNAYLRIRGILEENYVTQRILTMPCKLFSARQEKGESVASWGSTIDEMQTDLTEAARRVCKGAFTRVPRVDQRG